MGRIRRISFTVLPMMAMIFGIGKELMAQTNASTPVKNIVLVHGGFVDGSGWEGVYKALTKAGYPIKSKTLATMATRGGGPPYRLFGRRALYRWGDSLQWAQRRLSAPRCTTSEADATTGRGGEMAVMPR